MQRRNVRDAHHMRAMHAQELARIKLRYEPRQGIADEMHPSGGEYLNIIARCGNPLNVVDRHEKPPLCITDEDLPRGWRTARQAGE